MDHYTSFFLKNIFLADSATKESLHVSTPAARDHPPFLRKRRIILDRMILLPSKYVNILTSPSF